MKVVLYVAGGLFLLALNVWYARSLYRTFWSSNLPDVIASFQFIGREDKDGSQGRGLARMLVARLAYLQREIDQAERALIGGTVVPPSALSDRSALPKPVNPPQQITQQARVIDVPDIQVKVSGVEVTGLLAWVYRSVAEGRAIHTTMYSPGTNQRVTVAISLDTPRVDDLWIGDLEPNDGMVVDEIALEVVRQSLIQQQRIREAAALDRRQYRDLIETLRKIADLNNRVAQGYLPPSSDYAEIANRLEPLIERTPGWRALIDLAAQAAENARDLVRASALYQRELGLIDRTKDQDLAQTLEGRIAKLKKALEPSTSRAAATSNVAMVTAWPLNLLAIPQGLEMQNAPRVAILGGAPSSEMLKDLGNAEVLNEPAPPQQGATMQEYVGTVAAAVRAVAPKAHLIFAPVASDDFGGFSTNELIAAIDRLLAANPQVLVITLGHLESASETPDSVAYTQAVANAAKKCVVVVSAGNEGSKAPAHFERAGLLNALMSVASVGKNGERADFSSKSDLAFWAPGVDIPLQLRVKTQLTHLVRSGTTYSAALAGGVVARILDRKPGLTPAEVIKLLRDTAKPAALPDGPPILNLAAALGKLQP